MHNMIKEFKNRVVQTNYDHAPLTDAALAKPGAFFTDDADDYPTISPTQIRRGAMKDYRPAGAWTAKRIEGRIHVAFLGVPKQPWTPDAGEAFDDVERTLNPDRCPEGTPQRVLDALAALREATSEEARTKKPGAKKRKKKKAKKAES